MNNNVIDVDFELNKADFRLRACFQVPASGVTGIFGPSGSGKTSMLRALAGFEPDTQGHIRVQGQSWLTGSGAASRSLPVSQRRVGMVFQDASLFPHLSVEQNLLYGRKRLTKPSNIIDLSSFYHLLGVTELLARGVSGLSGGERQRVALGRALLAEPVLLLMDEPLSALDMNTRAQLMPFLENLFQQLETPVFYVSHSSEEIARLADNLILLEEGKVTACGDVQQVLGQVDGKLAYSDAAFSVLQGEIEASDLTYLTTVRCSGGQLLQLPRQDAAESYSAESDFSPGNRVRLRIRARDVSVCLQKPVGSSILNILPATISDVAVQPKQGSRIIKLDIGNDILLAMVSEHSMQQLGLHPGLQLFAQIKSAALLS